jgi:very-short-patch-repair endonuclease
MEYISPAFRLNFREFCVGLYVGQINDIFQMAGVTLGSIPPDTVRGDRRSKVMEYYASIDWSNLHDVQKFLKAVGIVLAQSYVKEDQKAQLRQICEDEGLVIDGHTVRFGGMRSGSQIKNIIFAANGPKPEIVLSDAIENEIQIVANAQYCVIYDRPILAHGLLWKDMVEWWRGLRGMQNLVDIETSRELYKRLALSLDSEPEKFFMSQYFKVYHDKLGEKLPALIPQVYFHYDPYTLKQLKGTKRLPRQRMDFLLLLPGHHRIVIEIDGKHHYTSESGMAEPKKYAEMVVEDRKLKLAGYEVYRFGGYEFVDQEKAREVVDSFFEALFKHYQVID